MPASLRLMSLAYFDTLSGIAGDMLLAALVDAGADVIYLEQQLRSLPGLQNVRLLFSTTSRHGFRALRLDVQHPPEHVHRHLSDIEAMIVASGLTDREREISLRIFRRLGAAEAKVHGTTIEQVHFHEVGAIDSIVDIVGIAVALTQLQITRIVASPTPTGSGTVTIAHGLVSVPAPATAELLRGIPIRHSTVPAELTTPTGAAVLATLVDEFGALPSMQISHIGCGAGHRELSEQANVLRVLLGSEVAVEGTSPGADDVLLLETNIDSASGEQLGYALEQVWQQSPLDVFTSAIAMKKNRPGTLLSVLCHAEQRAAIEESIFRHTGSLGIRCTRLSRRILTREIYEVETALGPARVKLACLVPAASATLGAVAQFAQTSSWPAEVRIAPEYEDCRRLANSSGQPLEEIRQLLIASAEQQLQQHARRLLSAPLPSAFSPDQHSHDHSHDHHH